MKQLLLLVAFTGCAMQAFAQVEAPFSFTSEDDNRLLKEVDSGKYYASDDSSNMVFLGDDPAVYKLMDNIKNVLAEGFFSTDGDKYLREGKWTEYYKNGKVKSTGYYQKNNPVGTWQNFYTSGRPHSICNYVMIENGATYYCMAGTYQEFYENGFIKVNGLYKATIDDRNKDTAYVIDPITDKKVIKTTKGSKPRAEKAGAWEYYNDKGELEKKEDNAN
jgi:antitoxin component YwqK of YwqJK toxin-antitoxin module